MLLEKIASNMEKIFSNENYKRIDGFGKIPQKTGVYFLFFKNQVVYIGKSRCLYDRIRTHRYSKIFDEFNYILCEKDSYFLERKYILEFRPKYNKLLSEIPTIYNDNIEQMKQDTVQTENQKKLMWRNAAIRKEFKTMNDGKNAITAIHKYLSEKYSLTTAMIRLIIAKKGGTK
jgi:hypothetical protein